MKREDQLDQFIERRYYQGGWRLVSDGELADSLAAAEKLAQLREIDAPADFARRLEGSLRAHVRRLPPPISQSSPQKQVLSHIHRYAPGAHRFPKRQVLVAVLGIAALLVAAFIALLSASENSLPDGPLYSLKQAANQIKLNFASDRTNAQIGLLQSALNDLQGEVTDRHSDASIKQALQIVASRTHDSQQAVEALAAGNERDEEQQQLTSILASEDQTLRQLLADVDWPLKILFTRQLGLLGDQVPVVTSMIIKVQPDGSFLVVLNGAFFSPQATFMVDGQPGGIVTQNNSRQLAAMFKMSFNAYSHVYGVLNPDGTAAQITLDKEDDQSPQDTR